ncbi:MAG: type 4a pilus biogenesis protein PilO, partial [Myxococcota bacterium]
MDKLVEQWAGIPQQQRYGIAIGLVIVIIGGYWYFFHTDSVRKLEQQQKTLLKLSQERTQQEEYVARLAQYEAKFNQLQQDLNEARSQLPDDADVPQLLAQLDNNARQSGLNIVRFEPKAESDKGFYA